MNNGDFVILTDADLAALALATDDDCGVIEAASLGAAVDRLNAQISAHYFAAHFRGLDDPDPPCLGIASIETARNGTALETTYRLNCGYAITVRCPLLEQFPAEALARA
jgi:hypothetical protein